MDFVMFSKMSDTRQLRKSSCEDEILGPTIENNREFSILLPIWTFRLPHSPLLLTRHDCVRRNWYGEVESSSILQIVSEWKRKQELRGVWFLNNSEEVTMGFGEVG